MPLQDNEFDFSKSSEATNNFIILKPASASFKASKNLSDLVKFQKIDFFCLWSYLFKNI